MRTGTTSRLVLAALLVAAQAVASPLDTWLDAVADRDVIVLVPRADRVAGPLSAAAERLTAHPALAELTAGLREAAPWPTSLAEHARLGLAPDGPLLLASGPIAFLPIPDPSKGARYLEAVGLEGVTRHVGGVLVVAPDEVTIEGVLAAKAGANPFADCPRAKGEADLFARWSLAGVGRACATVRVDPGRVRVDVRVLGPPARALSKMLGTADDPLSRHLGSRVTTTLSLGLGRAALDDLASRAPDPFWKQVRGGLALGAGPAPGTVTLAVRINDPARAKADVDRLLAAQSRLRVVPDGKGWTLRTEGSEVRLELRGDVLVASTGAPARGDHRDRLVGPARTDGRLLRGAPFAWYLRLAGPPRDGRAFSDAAGPALAALGLRPAGLDELTSAAAFLLAHVSEIGVSLRRDGPALVGTLEVITL